MHIVALCFKNAGGGGGINGGGNQCPIFEANCPLSCLHTDFKSGCIMCICGTWYSRIVLKPIFQKV